MTRKISECNLRFAYYEGGGQILLKAEKPRAVRLQLGRGNWHYLGGLFAISHGVRITKDNNVPPGCFFVFDWTDPRGRKKMAQIRRDLEAHGHLEVA